MKNIDEINIDKEDLKEWRKRLELNQTDFWGPVGVTQSGGARYEMTDEGGRRLPKPVKVLLYLVYVLKADIFKIKRQDIQIMNYIKTEPQLYKRLKDKALQAQKDHT